MCNKLITILSLLLIVGLASADESATNAQQLQQQLMNKQSIANNRDNNIQKNQMMINDKTIAIVSQTYQTLKSQGIVFDNVQQSMDFQLKMKMMNNYDVKVNVIPQQGGELVIVAYVDPISSKHMSDTMMVIHGIKDSFDISAVSKPKIVRSASNVLQKEIYDDIGNPNENCNVEISLIPGFSNLDKQYSCKNYISGRLDKVIEDDLTKSISAKISDQLQK